MHRDYEGGRFNSLLQRDSEEGAKFFAMIKWDLRERRLNLGKSPKSPAAEHIAIDFVFDEQGNIQTEKRCRMLLDRFVSKFGGDDSNTIHWQWMGCAKLHEDIWDAAIKVWGYPREVNPEVRIPRWILPRDW